jgi:hypothetical protein
MSIETARIEVLHSGPSLSKNACKVAGLRPGLIQGIEPVAWSATQVR